MINFLKQTKKSFAHYLNPNQNPTDYDKKALQLLDRGEVDLFIKFIEENQTIINLNVVDYNKASLLIKAQDVANNSNPFKKMFSEEQLKNRAIKAVNYLLAKGVDINYRDKNGITALLSACHWGNNQIAEILLQNGADPNLSSNTNNFFTNPLLSACFKKNTELIIMLLKYGADLEQTIELNNKGNGFKLNQNDINRLRSMANIATLVRKRREDQFYQRRNILSELPEPIFEDICFKL